VRYRAALSGTCTYSDGSSAPCAVPAGTVTWQLDGGDLGGNFMFTTEQWVNCTTAVGGEKSVAGCDVTWPTYGTQAVSATYVSDPTDPFNGQFNVPETVTIQLVAPVDLAAGLSFNTYDNTGPSGIGDCTFAAAADWITATDKIAPSAQSIVAGYWAAEAADNGGQDVGLTTAQLFDYWQSSGIGGTTLTGLQAVPLANVETELSEHYVLYGTVNLPAGFPTGQGQGGGHAWLVVGYSSYGPMIVSWGQEVQISWSQFDSWTTGIWALGATQPV
jgi:hypothetical protein